MRALNQTERKRRGARGKGRGRGAVHCSGCGKPGFDPCSIECAQTIRAAEETQ